MNYTQSFEEFSKSLSPTDLLLYAGIGLVLWVLFKDKLNPVQAMITNVFTYVKGLFGKTNKITAPKTSVDTVVSDEDIFYKLVVSWKNTRDLAVQSGCTQAVKVADQMFPYLSPSVCKEGLSSPPNPTKDII
jgi:hypothetical protein